MRYIINRHFEPNTEDHQKAHAYVWNTLASLLVTILYWNYGFWMNNKMNWGALLCIGFLITIVLLLYFWGNLKLCVNIGSGVGLSNLIFMIVNHESVFSQVLIFMLVIPLFTLTFLGMTSCIIWSIITVASQVGVFYYCVSFDNESDYVTDNTEILINAIMLLIVIMGMLITYESIKKRQQQIIEQYVKELLEQKEILIQKNKELERFAFSASHDLKTPIRNIVSFSSLLKRKLKNTKDAEVEQYATFIKDYAYHMSQLVDDILEFSKIGKAEDKYAEFVELESVKEYVIELLKDTIQKRNARIRMESVLPKVKGKQEHLVQLMQNLLENALMYNEQEQPEITIGMSEDIDVGKYIFIKDNGIGIDAPYREKVFEMFTRLHTMDKYQGTGLGLAICKKIVLQYGGRIWIDSMLNKGTTVKFILPQIL